MIPPEESTMLDSPEKGILTGLLVAIAAYLLLFRYLGII